MITYDQALSANVFHSEYPADACTRTEGPRGGVTERVYLIRRNGATKTWKTRPGEFRIPVKYGIRQTFYISNENAAKFHVPDDCPLSDRSATTKNREKLLS